MEILKFGLKFFKKYLPLALLTQLMGFSLIFLSLLMPQLARMIIDFVFIPLDSTYMGSEVAAEGIFSFLLDGYGGIGAMELMVNIALLSVALMAAKHILMYSRNSLQLVWGFKMERELKRLTFDKLLSTSNAVLSRYNTGDLMTIMVSDTVLFRDLYMRIIPYMLDALFAIGISVYFLFNIYAPLALLPLFAIPFQLALFVRYIKKARAINNEIRDSTANLSRNVQENINGVRIIRSFAAEDFEIKKFDKHSSTFKNAYFRQAEFVTKYGFGFNLIRQLLYISCIAAGGALCMVGKIGIGAFTAFISYVFSILDNTTSIVNFTFEFQRFLVCVERIYTFLHTGNIIDEPLSPKQISMPPHIRLENVSLSMDGKAILQGISLDIPYGKKVGIMGSTSSGKSVLLKVLTRLMDPTGGRVYVNGVNLKEIGLEQVRRIYSYVPQEVFLFSNTIDSNIALYDIDMPHEKVIECAKAAQAHDFILKTSEGYDTVVGERGIGLSGGQKQRISVARALAKDAPVLMLDDVTSALDANTEKTLLEDIFSRYPDRTIIITAHRATSVKGCEIIYLEDGRITERGTHEELMELNGRYADIYRRQTADRIGE
jgi:ABC-type multidrug transport system fused ATPase/permease subunit